jgi:hypothetical protein
MPFSKYSPKQKRLARIAEPRDAITEADFKELNMKRKKMMGGGYGRKKMMGGGAMMTPRKQMAAGGAGRKKMKNGGKMVKGPCS